MMKKVSFHLISEFFMAILLIVSGYILLRNNSNGGKIFLVAHGMLLYSVLNAEGYYGERGNTGMTFMFLSFFIISSAFIVLGMIKKKSGIY